jgi:hypothetical protein
VCELTLEALGYRHDEAVIARRIHDLVQPHEERAQVLRHVLCLAHVEADIDATASAGRPHRESAT